MILQLFEFDWILSKFTQIELLENLFYYEYVLLTSNECYRDRFFCVIARLIAQLVRDVYLLSWLSASPLFLNWWVISVRKKKKKNYICVRKISNKCHLYYFNKRNRYSRIIILRFYIYKTIFYKIPLECLINSKHV